MDFYVSRLEAGWTIAEIDSTDFLHWCDILVYKAEREHREALLKLDNTNY